MLSIALEKELKVRDCLRAKLLLLCTVCFPFCIFSLLCLDLLFGTWDRPGRINFSTDNRQVEGIGWGDVCSRKGPTQFQNQPTPTQTGGGKRKAGPAS